MFENNFRFLFAFFADRKNGWEQKSFEWFSLFFFFLKINQMTSYEYLFCRRSFRVLIPPEKPGSGWLADDGVFFDRITFAWSSSR